jgi:hypothetical protein
MQIEIEPANDNITVNNSDLRVEVEYIGSSFIYWLKGGTLAQNTDSRSASGVPYASVTRFRFSGYDLSPLVQAPPTLVGYVKRENRVIGIKIQLLTQDVNYKRLLNN